MLLPELKHTPKDLNPDPLGWNQPCYRYTKGTCYYECSILFDFVNFVSRLQVEKVAIHDFVGEAG